MGIQSTGMIAGGRRAVCIGASLILLAGCDETGEFNLFKAKPQSGQSQSGQSPTGSPKKALKSVEQDVERPDVFQKTDMGLWDGRPSLGGVWIAHPDVKDPERAIIRNTANSKTVIGALFRRERDNPGPVMQVSSDAATALGMLAGSPAELTVTALRTEVVELEPEEVPMEAATTEELDAPQEIEATALDSAGDPVAGAAAAIDAAEIETATATGIQPAAATEVKPAPAPAPKKSSLKSPFIQVGIFSVQKNANAAALAMRQAGVTPTVKKQTSNGKTFWRVVVGPAVNKSERTALMKKIKGAGYKDAYFVTD